MYWNLKLSKAKTAYSSSSPPIALCYANCISRLVSHTSAAIPILAWQQHRIGIPNLTDTWQLLLLPSLSCCGTSVPSEGLASTFHRELKPFRVLDEFAAKHPLAPSAERWHHLLGITQQH